MIAPGDITKRIVRESGLIQVKLLSPTSINNMSTTRKFIVLCSDSGSVGVVPGTSGFACSVTRKVLVDFGLLVGIP